MSSTPVGPRKLFCARFLVWSATSTNPGPQSNEREEHLERNLLNMKILIVSSICTAAIETLRQRHDVLCAVNAEDRSIRRLIKDCEVLIFRSGVCLTADLLQYAPKLRLLIRAGSGTDNVDLDYAKKQGISFFRIPEPGAQAVAEMSFALM